MIEHANSFSEDPAFFAGAMASFSQMDASNGANLKTGGAPSMARELSVAAVPPPAPTNSGPTRR